ncbi:alpha/beta fold hydrolase [Bauldia sp.]|uniref:alpha/beta fold hydrolase n=1 Tax=Bauldia sp. TaxID=2575872 RepID=UPI003BA9ADF7
MLNYNSVGPADAPCVALLHGVGTTSRVYRPVVDRLPDLRCILVDLPGHGQSRDVAWVSLEETAKALGAVVEAAVGDADCHLVGASLGGYVGLTAMSQRPGRFRSATLTGIHAANMPRPLPMKIMTALMAPFVSRPFFARRTAKMLGATDADTQLFVEEAATVRAAAFRRALANVIDFAAPMNLEEIETATLFLAGGREHPLIRSSLPAFAERLKAGRAAEVPGLGHGWPLQDPALFAETVRAQVRGAALPKGLNAVGVRTCPRP